MKKLSLSKMVSSPLFVCVREFSLFFFFGKPTLIETKAKRERARQRAFREDDDDAGGEEACQNLWEERNVIIIIVDDVL